LIEAGAGPVIVGRAGDADVLRLENFLRRNGHPHQRLDPGADEDARALLERFTVDRAELPIVLCPGGQLLRNPGEAELARCLGLIARVRLREGVRRRDRGRGSGRTRRGRLRGLGRSVRPAARLSLVRWPGRRVGADRELSRFPDRDQRHGADGARPQPGAEVRRRDGDSRGGGEPGGGIRLAAAEPCSR
jgi:hypothetical protein